MRTKSGWILFFLAGIFLAGLWLRLYELGAAGVSEDESHKIAAVDSYLNGDITANAEHPMLMKNLMLVSVVATRWWNAHTPFDIREEAAMRFPNAFFGAATAIPIYYFAAGFFGPEVGLLSAAFWSTGMNAISFNRVGKEETLMVFFTIPAFYFYRRAKCMGTRKLQQQSRWYSLSGAMFGLQLAAKYLPGFIGLNALFYYLLGRNRQNQPIPRNLLARYLGVMVGVFLLMDITILAPSVWVYFANYLGEKLLVHHGYQMMETLYYNVFSKTPYGTPFYFYFLYLLVKTPPPLLVFFLAGLAYSFVHRKGTGTFFLRFVFIWWFLPYSFFAAKWLRYSLSYLPYFYITAAVGFVVSWRQVRKYVPQKAAAWGAACILIGFLAANAWYSLPLPAMYVNFLGEGKQLYYFPQDELYDAGFREAYEYLAHNAAVNSCVSTDAAGVFDYYTTQFGRTDLRRISFSKNGQQQQPRTPVYALLHEGNRYFENDSIFHYLKTAETPLAEVKVDGIVAVRIYKMAPSDFAEAERITAGAEGR